MKLHILSDLHIECADFTIPETDADVIILAGDIGVGLSGLEWLKDQAIQKPVIYVPGNHEYYHHDINLFNDIQVNCASNTYLLNDNVIEIEGVRFLGSVLWTDFDLFGVTDRYFSIQQASKNMADFEVIKHLDKRFTPDDSISLHNKCRGWLKCMLDDEFHGTTVVITHHAPSMGSVHARFARNLLTPAFASDLEAMMGGDRVSLWIHGHTHNVFDYQVHGTRIVCNPRGYAPYEDTGGFAPDFLVEL